MNGLKNKQQKSLPFSRFIITFLFNKARYLKLQFPRNNGTKLTKDETQRHDLYLTARDSQATQVTDTKRRAAQHY